MGHEVGEIGISHAVGDGLAAGEIAEIAHRRVRAIEKPELHQLEWHNVGHEGGGPVRPSAGEPVLDHPVVVDFGDHGQASSSPVAAAMRARSASVVAGTMRSTMVAGKATCSATWTPSGGSTSAARRATTLRTERPLDGRLSQHRTVKGGRPRSHRSRRAATRKPGAETGVARLARSCTMSGCASFSSPVAGRGNSPFRSPSATRSSLRAAPWWRRGRRDLPVPRECP